MKHIIVELFECSCKYRDLVDITMLTTTALNIFKESQMLVKSGNRYEDKEITLSVAFILEKGEFFMNVDVANKRVRMVIDIDEKSVETAINIATNLFKPAKYKIAAITIDEKPNSAEISAELYQLKDEKYVKVRETKKKKEIEE